MKDQLPSVTESEKCGSKAEDHSHPAFGTIVMSSPTGGSGILFGSDIRHNQCVRIEIHRAEMRRSISQSWVFQRELVATVEMSHAQFAQFITSSGKGSGTPCSIRYAAPVGSKIEEMPGIQQLETKGQTFRREIQESTKHEIEEIENEVERLGALIESGKLPKTELREIHRTLKNRLGNLPSNMGYVVQSAEEAMDKIASATKIDIETYLDNHARQLGINAMTARALLSGSPDQTLPQITDNSGTDSK